MTSQNVWAAVWRSMRPGQWQKNLIVYAPLLFSTGTGWDPRDASEAIVLLGHATFAFVLLCLAASGGYLLNDVRDVRADRTHSARRERAVAAGLLPVRGPWRSGWVSCSPRWARRPSPVPRCSGCWVRTGC